MVDKSRRLSIIAGTLSALVVTLSVLFPSQFAQTFPLTLVEFQELFGALFVVSIIWAIRGWKRKPTYPQREPRVEKPPVVELEETVEDNVWVGQAPKDRTAVRDKGGERNDIRVEEVEGAAGVLREKKEVSESSDEGGKD